MKKGLKLTQYGFIWNETVEVVRQAANYGEDHTKQWCSLQVESKGDKLEVITTKEGVYMVTLNGVRLFTHPNEEVRRKDR